MALRLGTVRVARDERAACLRDDGRVVLLPTALGDTLDIISRGPECVAELRAIVERSSDALALSDVHVLAPLRRFKRDVLCTGWNYWDHFYESEGKREGQDVPKPVAPTFFTKGPATAIAPNAPIAFDANVSSKWDYEAEIVVVIGVRGRSVPQAHALDHVWGYCLANDVSQRDLQRRHGGQWLKGKSIDATMPFGPWIVHRDDVAIGALQFECELNGTTMQRASVNDMAFAIPELISELSFGMTIEAGDVLLTGTPSGIGNARTPPVFLADGDRVVVRGGVLGELDNRLVATDLSAYCKGDF
ncbi:fumarylacetoacetate hydrolase family protein [Pararobbsia silviterrae]|uniref:Fumarylacetoacetate hydrolase family protein n=1 Tax=Pararobbsia silviterrae TaxID=1792498 RepID=A0A494WZF5_9BURK|nr:fumarylacetoacetate hydrolase family protein [Pararobbsia silviterrae]RKP43918.1 fumarylacetoacetate hydrolase family protein [Pararobbsia silviterrae]